MTHEPHDQYDNGGVQPPDGDGPHGGHPDRGAYGEAAYGEAAYGQAGYGHTGYADPGYGDPGHADGYGAAGQGYGTHAHGYQPAPAPGGWGGEYDADATAFVQLPGPGTDLPTGADPLAAPGTGQGGYTPPPLADFEHRGGPGLSDTGGHDPSGVGGVQGTHTAGPAHGGAPMTPAATTDPSSPGQWTMPFAAAATDAAGFGAGLSDAAGPPEHEAYAHLGAPAENAAAPDEGPPPASVAAPAHTGGAAAAMGQGAAAALAGSHEARTQRRPLGTGGAAGRADGTAAVPDDSAPAGPSGATGPPQPAAGHPGAPGPETEYPAAQPGTQFADSMARRQVPFAAPSAPDPVSWPEPGTLSVPRPAGPGPAEQVPGTDPPPSATGPIPYADSSPGHEAPMPAPDGGGPLPEPHAGDPGLPAPRRPSTAGETTEGPTWPEPGTFAGPDGSPVPAAAHFSGRPAPEVSWPGPADIGTPADADGPMPEPGGTPEAAPTPGEEAAPAPETAPASAAVVPPARTAEGSPPSRIPFVPSTPGREAQRPEATAAEPAEAAAVGFPRAEPVWEGEAPGGSFEPGGVAPTAGPEDGQVPGHRAAAPHEGQPPPAGPAAEAASPPPGAAHRPPADTGPATPGDAPNAVHWPEPGHEAEGPPGAGQVPPPIPEPASPGAPGDPEAEGPPAPGVPSWHRTGGDATGGAHTGLAAEGPEPTSGAEPPGAAAGDRPDTGVERHDPAGEPPAASGDAPGPHPAPGETDGGSGTAGWAGPAGPDDSGEFAASPTAPAPVEPEPETSAHSEHPHVSYVLRVNGVDRPVAEAWIGESLLYVLRERLGLAGAKDGCSQGECGACSVQVDGRLVASCLVPAATAAGTEVRTVEGLGADGEPSDVQRALARCGAVQCGFCVPGLAMAVHELLEGNHAPTELETRQAICGNLCRCSGYRGVIEAVETVVSERTATETGEGAQAAPPSEAPLEGGDG